MPERRGNTVLKKPSGASRTSLPTDNEGKIEFGLSTPSLIRRIPTYQVPDEATERLAALQEGGEALRSGAAEARALSEQRVGMEAPGMAIEKENIRQSTAADIEAAQMSGSPSSLSAITNIGAESKRDLLNSFRMNSAYREQAEADLASSIYQEAGASAQAAGLEAQGLSGMVGERGKVHQSKTDKALTGIDYQITSAAADQDRQIQEDKRTTELFGKWTGLMGKLGGAAG